MEKSRFTACVHGWIFKTYGAVLLLSPQPRISKLNVLFLNVI